SRSTRTNSSRRSPVESSTKTRARSRQGRLYACAAASASRQRRPVLAASRGRRSQRFFKERTWASERARGSKGGRPSAPTPLAGSPKGNRDGAWTLTQEGKADRAAR